MQYFGWVACRYQKTGHEMCNTLSGTYVSDLHRAGNDHPGDTETRHRYASRFRTTEVAATWKRGGGSTMLIQDVLDKF
jgi:hypothetical protein